MSDETTAAIELDKNARQWAMICHLSALIGLLGNGVGFLIAPLVVWLIKKNEHPFIDEQGKEALNFQITMFLAVLVSIPLCFVGIGIILLPVIGVLMFVFPIIAGIKANDGKSYRYPMTIRFVK